MTVNEDYFDAELRHAIDVQRFTQGEVNRVLTLLAQADADLVRRLRRHLRGLAGQPLDIRSERMRAMIKDIAVLRSVLIRKLRGDFTDSMLAYAPVEAGIESNIILSVLPIDITLAGVQAATLRAAVMSEPFSGGAYAARTLSQWFKDLEQVDQKRLVGALQLGLAQGESIDDIVRRVAGTRAANYRDGVLAVSRRNAESIVRTAVNHVSNSAREAVWDANAELFDGLRWTSTLDGRTTPVCQSRDGKIAPIGGKPIPRHEQLLVPPGARPPAHPQCFPAGTLVSGRAEGAFRSRYEGPLVKLETANGLVLSVTPNHRIATSSGFVPARELREGDKVLCNSSNVWDGFAPPGSSEIDKNKLPSKIEDVFAALAMRSPSICTTLSNDDFHGDAVWMPDHNVNIVGSNSKRSSFPSPRAGFMDRFLDFVLPFTSMAKIRHCCFRAKDFLLKAVRTPTTSIPGSGALLLDGSPIHFRPLESFGLGSAAYVDPVFDESSLEDAAVDPTFFAESLQGHPVHVGLGKLSDVGNIDPSGFGVTAHMDAALAKPAGEDANVDAELFAELFHRYPGEVVFDQIVKVRNIDFSGHVYDLQSPNGWIVAEGIVTSNCRSVMVAIFSANGVALVAGERPFVRSTTGGRGRQRDFRREAQAKAGERWTRMSSSQRTAATNAVRLSWAQRVVGRVPAKTTYQEWLTKQPWAFQVDVLGPTRAKLFRDGGLSLDSFVDIRGKELTLAELAKTHPAAFRRAGVSP